MKVSFDCEYMEGPFGCSSITSVGCNENCQTFKVKQGTPEPNYKLAHKMMVQYINDTDIACGGQNEPYCDGKCDEHGSSCAKCIGDYFLRKASNESNNIEHKASES